MSRERADLGFANVLNDLDLSDFAPKPKRAVDDRPSKAVTAQAAEAAGFKSREPKPLDDMSASGPATRADAPKAGQGGAAALRTSDPLQPRRRRTGRNAQFNLKARPETIEAYCALADRMGWGLGETLERAVDLLERHYGRSA